VGRRLDTVWVRGEAQRVQIATRGNLLEGMGASSFCKQSTEGNDCTANTDPSVAGISFGADNRTRTRISPVLCKAVCRSADGVREAEQTPRCDVLTFPKEQQTSRDGWIKVQSETSSEVPHQIRKSSHDEGFRSKVGHDAQRHLHRLLPKGTNQARGFGVCSRGQVNMVRCRPTTKRTGVWSVRSSSGVARREDGISRIRLVLESRDAGAVDDRLCERQVRRIMRCACTPQLSGVLLV
jgi:hypothetical protein